MVDNPDDELMAREYIQAMIDQGHAIALMDAFSEHSQSCHYVYGILQHLAYEVDSGISDEIVNFARNLLDDWSK